MVFPVVMYRCEIWTRRKAEHQRIDAFGLWCWRRLLRVPWLQGDPNSPILKEISPEYSLEGLMLKLKLQYFGHLMWRTESFAKNLIFWERFKAGGEGDDRRWDDWMASPTQWTWQWVNSGSWWRDREAWPAAVHGVAKGQTQLGYWTDLSWTCKLSIN